MASKDGGPRKTRIARKTRTAMVDRLSSLPDELLSHILSLLPTKCAVGTSILSNRWKYLWTSLTSFHFNGIIDRHSTNIFYHIFRSCSSSHIQKFSLHITLTHNSNVDVTAWIEEATKRNVSELDIQVNGAKLPLNVFSYRTLKILTLAYKYHLDGNSVSLNLPCLKVLHITKDSYLNGFIETLISSCPVLEDLTLGGYLDEEHFMVSASMLKTLQLHLIQNYCIPGANKISVIAPNLLYFHLDGYFVRYKIKGDFSSVVKACVNIRDISGGSYRAYRPFQRDLPHRFTFPKFHNLKYLEVISRHDLFWTMLSKLIRISPSLEVLSIEQHGHDGLRADLYTWDGPTSVHKCLRVHLAEIKIKGFTGRKHELQLLKYFLGNAKVLQRLTITCPAELKQAQKTMFCEELLKFSKASRKCQIEYQGELISN